MSMGALLKAFRDTLREKVPFSHDECDLGLDGTPPPWCGERFIRIWGAGWSPGEENDGIRIIDELTEVAVTITYRTGAVPHDEQANELWVEDGDGMSDVAHRIMRAVSANAELIMCRATAYIHRTRPNDQGFVIAPRWDGTDPTPRVVGPDWFSAEPSEGSNNFGVAIDIRFGRSRRVETYRSTKP